MPKQDSAQIVERMNARLDEFRQGKDVAARDLRALLTSEQVAAMDSAWAEQQLLRKGKRARTEEEEASLGWKSKRVIHIEALERAIEEVNRNALQDMREELRRVEVRRARVYLDAYFEARESGSERDTAENEGNNALVRAGLRTFLTTDDFLAVKQDRKDRRVTQLRLGRDVWEEQLKRDGEVREMELEILRQEKSKMSPDELEQLELLEEHEKRAAEFLKRRGK